MIPIKQRNRHKPDEGIYGDCVRASLASILEMPYEDVPDFAYCESQQTEVRKWLRSFGYDYISFFWSADVSLAYVQERMRNWTQDVYYLLGGNSSGGVGHVVVCLNGEIVHDPHPNNVGISGPFTDTDEPHYATEFIVAPGCDAETKREGAKLTHTRTYATLEVSSEAYQEIKRRLKEAGQPQDGPEIDMNGIALVEETPRTYNIGDKLISPRGSEWTVTAVRMSEVMGVGVDVAFRISAIRTSDRVTWDFDTSEVENWKHIPVDGQ